MGAVRDAGWVAIAAALGVAPANAQPDAPPHQVVTLVDAQFCLAPALGDAIPGPQCQWRSVRLPDGWRFHGTHSVNDDWFKLKFDLEKVPDDGLAFFATSFNRSGRVFVSSTRLLAIGSMREPLPSNWRSRAASTPASEARRAAFASARKTWCAPSGSGGCCGRTTPSRCPVRSPAPWACSCWASGTRTTGPRRAQGAGAPLPATQISYQVCASISTSSAATASRIASRRREPVSGSSRAGWRNSQA
jgi:hypothetical protein